MNLWRRGEEITLKVYCDWGSTGIWVYGDPTWNPPGGTPDNYGIRHQTLGLPKDLSKEFEKWHAEFDKSEYWEPIDDDVWWEEGRRLAVELKRFVGEYVRVVYLNKGSEEEING